MQTLNASVEQKKKLVLKWFFEQKTEANKVNKKIGETKIFRNFKENKLPPDPL